MSMTVVQGMNGSTPPKRAPKSPGPEHDDCDLTWQGSQRCKAHSTQADPRRRCANPVTPGATVCSNHGSLAPQVRRKAQFRLAALVDPAIGQLARLLATGDDAIKMRAIENILDRNGYPRKMEVDTDTAKALLIDRLIRLRDEGQQTITTAEVITDYEEPDDQAH